MTSAKSRPIDTAAMERLMSSLPRTNTGHILALQNQLTAACVTVSYAAQTVQAMGDDEAAACAHIIVTLHNDANDLLRQLSPLVGNVPSRVRRLDALCDN